MDGPLSGLRVLDLSHVLAGPYATGQLALMGADVIRVERPNGDDFVRRHGGTEAMKAAGFGASFLSQNAGKRSIVLDLKSEAGRNACLDLAETADIVTENFRPGVTERLGVGFDAVRARRPNVIYASLTGFGAEGPLAGRPAYDHILQGISGLMAMTGTPASGPMRVGPPIADYIAGQALVAALLGAVIQRAKAPSAPQRIEVSMLEALTTMMGAFAINFETTGKLRGLEGNRAFADTPFSGRFETADGWLVVTANTPAQSTRMCAALERPDLLEAAPETVAPALEALFRTLSAQEWEDRLAEANVPAAKVRTLAEALAHPQMAGSPAWLPLDQSEVGVVTAPALPFRAPWAPTTLPPAPAFGADTDAVLAEVGCHTHAGKDRS